MCRARDLLRLRTDLGSNLRIHVELGLNPVINYRAINPVINYQACMGSSLFSLSPIIPDTPTPTPT
ncbi:hypothetical protein Dimus_005850, partial [Dionaea muscipula]